IERMGFNPDYYTAVNNSYDLPYDLYRPHQATTKTQIELVQKNGSFLELSQASSIVSALTGKVRGDERFYFPREITHGDEEAGINLFESLSKEFSTFFENDEILPTQQTGGTL
ncbi:MAG: hypothetical protein WAT69_11000, partial [Trichococcus flocculiformis]